MLQAFKDLEKIEPQVFQNDEIILRVFNGDEKVFRGEMVDLMQSVWQKEPLMLIEFPRHDKLGVVWERSKNV